jgi:hypothetical protein
MRCCQDKRRCRCRGTGPDGAPGPDGAISGAWIKPGVFPPPPPPISGSTNVFDTVVVDFDAIPASNIIIDWTVRWSNGPGASGTVVWEVRTGPAPASGPDPDALIVPQPNVLATAQSVPFVGTFGSNSKFVSHLTLTPVAKPTGKQYVQVVFIPTFVGIAGVFDSFSTHPSFFTISPV